MKKIFIFIAIVSFLCCTGFTQDIVLLKTDGCAIFGSPSNSNDTAYWIDMALNVMKYIGIVMLLAYSIIDFVKAITEQDNGSIQKAAKRTGKRIIYVVLLFFVPIIVNYLMNFLGLYGTCGYGESGNIGYVN